MRPTFVRQLAGFEEVDEFEDIGLGGEWDVDLRAGSAI